MKWYQTIKPSSIISTLLPVLVLIVAFNLHLKQQNNHPHKTNLQTGITQNSKYFVPTIKPDSQPIDITAQSAIGIDVNTSAVLFEKSSHLQLPPASTTKMMTALIAIREYDLNDVVVVTNEDQSIGSKIDLVPGEKITVHNLLQAMLVGSGNDAALALAKHHPQGYQHFVDLMNQEASYLSMDYTHYSNVSGVDGNNHYTTASDLTILAKELLKDSLLQNIVKTKAIVISNIDGSITHHLSNTNELLGKTDGVLGVKTGWSEDAGECLVTYTVRDNHPILVVILNSSDRFGESDSIINWIYQNHAWNPINS